MMPAHQEQSLVGRDNHWRHALRAGSSVVIGSGKGDKGHRRLSLPAFPVLTVLAEGGCATG